MLNVIAVNPANENATLGATAMMDGGLTLRSATGSLGSSGEEAFSASQGLEPEKRTWREGSRRVWWFS